VAWRPRQDNKELIHLVGKSKVETLPAADTTGRLMLQCARQVRTQGAAA
jgi:hypothetical protein